MMLLDNTPGTVNADVWFAIMAERSAVVAGINEGALPPVGNRWMSATLAEVTTLLKFQVEARR